MSAENWKPFSDDWAEALKAPPRALPALHMADCFRYGWSEIDRQKKLVSLAEVIEKYKPLSIECSVSVSDFNDVLGPVVAHDLRHPYFACFHGLLYQSAAMISQLGLKGPLEFVFDEQGPVGFNAADFYLLMKGLYPQKIRELLAGPPQFKDDTEVLPLQAADMLAWHRRAIQQPGCTDDRRIIADRIVFKHGITEIPRPMLEHLAEAFSKVPGIGGARGHKGSMRKLVSQLTNTLPPDQLVPAMEAISKRGIRLRRWKSILERLGLRKLWKRLAKRPFTVRW
jgi:hypothetical protein